MSKVTVALEALSKDSAQWQETSQTLNAASGSSRGLTLTVNELSWLSEGTGLLASYEEIRGRVETLLDQGATETGKISSTLAQVRHTYESSDRHAINDLHGVWDVNK